jgi:hypothetical protein
MNYVYVTYNIIYKVSGITNMITFANMKLTSAATEAAPSTKKKAYIQFKV